MKSMALVPVSATSLDSRDRGSLNIGLGARGKGFAGVVQATFCLVPEMGCTSVGSVVEDGPRVNGPETTKFRGARSVSLNEAWTSEECERCDEGCLEVASIPIPVSSMDANLTISRLSLVLRSILVWQHCGASSCAPLPPHGLPSLHSAINTANCQLRSKDSRVREMQHAQPRQETD